MGVNGVGLLVQWICLMLRKFCLQRRIDLPGKMGLLSNSGL